MTIAHRIIAARSYLAQTRSGFLLGRYSVSPNPDPTIKTIVIDEGAVELRFNSAWVEAASDLDIQMELCGVAQAHTPSAEVQAAIDKVFGKA